MSIDDLIAALQKAREESCLGGETVVCLCEDEREYTQLTSVALDHDPNDASAVCLVKVGE